MRDFLPIMVAIGVAVVVTLLIVDMERSNYKELCETYKELTNVETRFVNNTCLVLAPEGVRIIYRHQVMNEFR